jgi:hypothetical protein
MTRTNPAETKLVICVWHPFSLWNPPSEMAQRIRERWPEMRVVHLPDYGGLERELPDTGFSSVTRSGLLNSSWPAICNGFIQPRPPLVN